MKTKKVQRRQRKTLRHKKTLQRHQKTLQRRRKTLRGGGDKITFTDNKNNKCIFEEVNKIVVKRGENRIGTFDIDEKNFKYNELPVYDLGNMPSSATPITEIISQKKTTPELSDEEQLQRYQQAREQSQAEQLNLSRQFSYRKRNPAGSVVRRIVSQLQKKNYKR